MRTRHCSSCHLLMMLPGEMSNTIIWKINHFILISNLSNQMVICDVAAVENVEPVAIWLIGPTSGSRSNLATPPIDESF